jgi:hypothetical protein
VTLAKTPSRRLRPAEASKLRTKDGLARRVHEAIADEEKLYFNAELRSHSKIAVCATDNPLTVDCGTKFRPTAFVFLDGIEASKRSAASPKKGNQSCHVEPLFRLPHSLSLASRVLRLFQLTPSHIEEALALVALAFITVVFIAVAFTVVQPCAVEWR